METIRKEQLYYKKKEDGSVACSYDYFGTRMTCTINSTNVENYSMLGRIVVKDACGKNLKGKNGKDVEKKFYIKEHNPDKDVIVKHVEKNMDALYAEKTSLINENNNSSVDPNSITPMVAVARFGSSFIKTKCSFRGNNPERSEKKTIKLLEEMAISLSKKRMKDFTKKELEKALSKFGRNEIIRFHEFWQYCIDEGIANGDNNIVIPPAKKRDKYTAARNKMKQYSALTPNDQDCLYDELEKNFCGYKVGMAVELGACMYESDEVFNYIWGNISFKSLIGTFDDYAVLKRNYRRKNSPINNGSVVIAPRSAVLLKKRYHELIDLYGDENKVDQMPIVSKVKDPAVRLSSDAYKKDSHALLRAVLKNSNDYRKAEMRLEDDENMEIPSTYTILKNSYKNNIINRVRFSKNPEMREFLFGEIAYNDTSSMNYISFTTPEAQYRFYRALQILRKERHIDSDCSLEENDRTDKIIINPSTNLSYCKAFIEIVLEPGEEIMLSSVGGIVTDFYSVETD